jgi:4'-phosphopantetheinyl transferase
VTGAPPPGPCEVRVVAARLDLPPERVARLADTLTARERQRAERRLRPADRRRALIARGLLREVLGRATGRDPRALDIRVTAQGKPHLADGSVSFSVAHCGDEAMVALAVDRPVGIDIERHRSVTGLPDVAEWMLEPEAAAALAALPERRRPAALMAWWTRAEAYGKARGDGLRGAARLALAPSSAAPARVRAVDGRDPGGVWSILDLPVAPGWSAAVAAAGSDWRVVRAPVEEWGPAPQAVAGRPA